MIGTMGATAIAAVGLANKFFLCFFASGIRNCQRKRRAGGPVLGKRRFEEHTEGPGAFHTSGSDRGLVLRCAGPCFPTIRHAHIHHQP